MIGVYEIIAPDGMRYVGGSKRSVENRLSFHKARLRAGAHYNTGLQEAYDRYGWEAFSVRVTESDDPVAAEQRKIDYWLPRGKLFNRHPSASSAKGSKYTEAQKKHQSEKAKARCTPEWRAVVSERVKKQHEDGRFGYDVVTAKRREKWDRSRPHGLKGRKQTPEHKAAVQAARLRNYLAKKENKPCG